MVPYPCSASYANTFITEYISFWIVRPQCNPSKIIWLLLLSIRQLLLHVPLLPPAHKTTHIMDCFPLEGFFADVGPPCDVSLSNRCLDLLISCARTAVCSGAFIGEVVCKMYVNVITAHGSHIDAWGYTSTTPGIRQARVFIIDTRLPTKLSLIRNVWRISRTCNIFADVKSI